MPVVTRGGAHISFDDTGGDGRAVVLIHSLFLDRDMFAPLVTELSPRYRLITIDSRGHGRSHEDDRTPFSYWDLARDAWAVVDSLGIERAVVGGVGVGGYTALRMALLAQSRTEGLIAIGATAAPMDPRRLPGFRGAIEAWIDDERAWTTVRMIASLMIGGSEAGHAPWREKWLADTDRARVRAAAECLLNRDAILELVGEIRCPALVIRGAGDYTTTVEDTAELAANLGCPTEVHTIAGASLTPVITHPEEVGPLLRDFLAELPAVTTSVR